MATVRLQTPEQFDFKNPDSWTRWKRRFEQFRVASGLNKEDEGRQVSTLLYCMGEDAESVLTSTGISDTDKEKYQPVVSKLDEFFKVRKNTIYERARFNRRNQREGESIEQYLTALYELIENCDYGDMKDELLRDRIVVGIRDVALSEKLQLEATLTLEQAKKKVRQREAVKEQSSKLHGQGDKNDPIVLDAVRSQRHSREKGATPSTSSMPAGTRCTRCGHDKHLSGDRCPARNVICHSCKKRGHFSAQCFTQSKSASAHEVNLDSAYLDTLSGEPESVWSTKLKLEDSNVHFKLDTGAEVTAIKEETFRSLSNVQLKESTKVLYGPAHQPLKVLGQFSGTLSNGHVSSMQTVFVVKDLKTNLLGLPAINALQLISRVYATSSQSIKERFKGVFQGLGTIGNEYRIKLKDGAVPHAIHTARNVPIPLRTKVQEELDRMEALGVISKVEEPTPWCAGMVVVPKKSGKLRICVDLKPLNESVLRETHPIPKVDETLAQLAGATVFSKLDANSGFWQIPLEKDSRLLTTFITPSGRYCFNKLPFGISSAPELFQRRMQKILEALEGVVCQMDDILVFGSNQAEHDSRLVAVMERLEENQVTLNSEKCELGKRSVKFLGHIVDQEGIRPDPQKTAAILEMETPCNITELRRFMGMANQLGKFSPNLAELSQPLRELLSTKKAWLWGPSQEQAFQQVKEELSRPAVLALYDPAAKSKISADASSYGLGAVLLQQQGIQWRPVAYASRSMTDTERRYAQIEKEALAVTWACQKFSNYILGSKFLIESDHKPLIPLLGTKRLDDLPPRIVRFRLRLSKFDYSIEHVPGKLMYTADTLSRAPVAMPGESCQKQQDENEMFVSAITEALPGSETRLQQYKKAQDLNPECKAVKEYCRRGWPQKHRVPDNLKKYWEARGLLTVHNDLLLYNGRIVIPEALQRETLRKIHEGHQGIGRCRMRIRESVWWPGVMSQMMEMIRQCPECIQKVRQPREPLLTTPLPDYPWQMVGTDLFELKRVHYVIIVDYFSRYPEVLKLTSTTSSAVIAALQVVFSRYGIPEVVRSDNGPQYASQEFAQFAQSYGFQHICSSPKFPQSNGQVERTVQTVKQLLKQNADPYKSLLNYRATPFPWCGRSPAELLMGRRLRTFLPQTDEYLVTQWSYLPEFHKQNRVFKEKQKTSTGITGHAICQRSQRTQKL